MPTRVRALQTYVTRATRRRALESTRARSHMPRAYRSLHRRPAPARVALSSASSLYVATRQPTAVRIRPSRLAAGGRSASAGEAVGLTGTHDAPRACHGSQRTRETVSRPQARYAAASTPPDEPTGPRTFSSIEPWRQKASQSSRTRPARRARMNACPPRVTINSPARPASCRGWQARRRRAASWQAARVQVQDQAPPWWLCLPTLRCVGGASFAFCARLRRHVGLCASLNARPRARAHTYAADHGPHSSGQATRKRLDRCHVSGAHQSCAYLVVRSHARRPAGMHRRAGRSASDYALARCPMRAPAHVAIASNRHRRHEHALRSHAAAAVAAATDTANALMRVGPWRHGAAACTGTPRMRQVPLHDTPIAIDADDRVGTQLSQLVHGAPDDPSDQGPRRAQQQG